MSPNNCDGCGHDKTMCSCKTVKQVGGDHYQPVSGGMGHWDWVIATNMGYLAGNATKYVSRWWKKNGLQDLEKASSYIKKLIISERNAPKERNWHGNSCLLVDRFDLMVYTLEFVEQNKLHAIETLICQRMVDWQTIEDLADTELLLESLMGRARQAAGQAQGNGATTLTPQAASPALPHATGQAQGTTGQAPGTNGPTAEQISRSRALQGVEHPFGYDDDDGA